MSELDTNHESGLPPELRFATMGAQAEGDAIQRDCPPSLRWTGYCGSLHPPRRRPWHITPAQVCEILATP